MVTFARMGLVVLGIAVGVGASEVLHPRSAVAAELKAQRQAELKAMRDMVDNAPVAQSTTAAVQQKAAAKKTLLFIEGEVNSPTSSLVFIKDPVSGGCWLGIETRKDGITSLASAPAESCKGR